MNRQRITRWIIGLGVLIIVGGLAGLTFFLPHRTLRWWDPAYYEKPAWSPDENRILYLYTQRTNGTHLIVTDRNGILQQLDLALEIPRLPSWKSESEISVFLEQWGELGADLKPHPVRLLIYDLATGTSQSVEAPLPIASGIAWHPDGSQALISLRNTPPFTSTAVHPGIYRFTAADKQFRFWRTAEWPGAIKWSRDGRHVAFIDLVTGENHKHWQVKIVDVQNDKPTNIAVTTGILWNDIWNDISWSPSGEWLLINGTIASDLPSQSDVRGLYFISTTQLDHKVLWKSGDFADFDWSPNGEEVLVTTSGPLFGVSALQVLSVPKEYR